MKKLTTALLLLLCSTAFGQTILDKCYQASYATNYVYEDTFKVIIDTNSEDYSLHSENKLWKLLSNSVVKKLTLPEGISVGQSLEGKGKIIASLKVDVAKWNYSSNLLEVLGQISFVRVDCKYKIK